MSTLIEAYQAAKEGKTVKDKDGYIATLDGLGNLIIDGCGSYMIHERLFGGWTIEDLEQENDWEDFTIDLHVGIYEFMYLGARHDLYLAECYHDFIGYVYEINDEKRVFREPILYFNKKSQVFSISYEDGCEIYRPIAVRFKKC